MYLRTNGPEMGITRVVRPWSELSADERLSMMRDYVADVTAQVRSVAPLARSGLAVVPPEVRAINPTMTDIQWSALPQAQRDDILRRAREAAAAAARRGPSGAEVGLSVTNSLVTAGVSIATAVINGNFQRDLARIQAEAGTNQAQIAAATQRFMQESNERIAQLQVGIAEAARSGNAAQAEQMRIAMQQMQAAQSAAQANPQNSLAAITEALARMQPRGLPTAAWVGIGVGGLLIVGLGVYLVARKK